MLAIVKNNHWYIGIGDPTLIGWLTVLAYFVTAFLCLLCARKINKSAKNPSKYLSHHWWWYFLAIMMLLLGINKQLDLQSWLTITGKEIAQVQGWYEQRRQVQALFIACIVSIFICSSVVISQIIEFPQPINWLSVLGFLFLGSFVVIRAVSFHGIDYFLGFSLVGLKMNWLLELTGIGAICLSAYFNLSSSRNQS
jgi:hypothetical protein